MPGPSYDLITTPKEIEELAKTLNQVKEIAFDTEFIRESTFYPKLEILQIATREGAWLVDVQAFQERGRTKVDELQPLIDVLVNPAILKIVHAAHGDQECLLSAMGILAAPLFDTAVGASLTGMGDNIGLGNLLKSVLGFDHPKGYARTNWSKRPLPRPVLEYALLDVLHLIQVSDILFERLEKTDRKQWALDLSARFSEKSLYESPPDVIAKRLAQSGKFNVRDYGVLLELVSWREERVRELNVPKRWLADDGVLIDLAKIKPSSLEQLQGFRGLSKGELKAPHADRILQAVARGVADKSEIPDDLKRRSILQPNNDENGAMELMRVCLSLFAEDYQIASKHIVSPPNILPLLRLKPKSIEELQSSDLVSSQLGDEGMKRFFAFLTGHEALILENGQVKLKSL
jgi:ribonuclease D